MIIDATHSKIDILSIDRVNITYNLTSDGLYYGVECFREGADRENPREYCRVEHVTKNREQIEGLIAELVEKNVFPVHLKDVVEELFSVKQELDSQTH